MWYNLLKGGKADGEVPSDFPPSQLHRGQKEEREHTTNMHARTEVAMDHLTKDKDYYKKLKIVEEHSLPFIKKVIADYKKKNKSQEKAAAHVPLKKLTGNYAIRNMLLGGAAGGTLGATYGDDPKKGAAKGALYGAAAGLGASERIADIYRRRYESLQKARGATGNLSHWMKDKSTFGQKAHLKDYKKHWNQLGQDDRSEFISRAGIGAAAGAGLTDLGLGLMKKLREKENPPNTRRKRRGYPVYMGS